MHSVLDIHVHDIHISAMRDLESYMDEEKLTDAALAAKVECDRSMIAKIRRRKATPSLRLALALHSVTGVPIESFVSPEVAE